jgi:hypothetical protein
MTRRTILALTLALSALLAGVGLTSPAGSVSAAAATTTPLTNLAHLDWLGATVTPPAQADHTTYRMAEEPSLSVLWTYANLDPDGRFPSMFEPVHGSAPDIAGQGIANPIGAIWSAALMLDHLGLADEAARVMRALESTTASGTLTPDLGGCARTPQVTDAILAHL